MSVKVKHQAKLVEFLSNTDNEFVSRSKMAVTVLGYKNARSIYNVFSPEELTEIEHEAWEIRRKSTARIRAHVYDILGREAVKGNLPAIREFLDRTEGKVKVGGGSSVSTEKPGDVIVNVIGVTAQDTRKEDEE